MAYERPQADNGTRKRKNSKAFFETRKTASREGQESETQDSEEDVKGGDRKRVRWDGEVDEDGTAAQGEEDEDSIDSEPPEICLSVSCHHGRMGGAYYDPSKATLYVLEDTAESAHFDLTKMLLEQASPDIVITSSKSDEKFIESIRDFTDSSDISFQIRPNREFTPARGRERLLSLRLFSSLRDYDPSTISDSENSSRISEEPRNAYDFMRRRQAETGDPGLQRWSAAIRLSSFSAVETSPFCISAAGALLDHIARAGAICDLEDEGISGLGISSIESITLDEVMHINADALSSLQIFENENHASIHSDKTKEGLSLFAILNSTCTSLGRTLLRNWFLRPLLTLSTIASRHDALSCFLRPENLVTANTMHVHLKGIGNIPRVFSLLRGGKAGVREWQAIVKFVFHISLLREAILELNGGDNVDVVKRLDATLDIAGFREMGNAVNETIDWEESSNAGRVCIRPHIDEELDEWRRIFHGLDSVLSRVAAQLGGTVPPDYAESLNVVYFPQLGYLICVPLRDEWKNEEGTHVPQPPNDDFIFQFCTEQSAYFKSPEMQDLDHHIGDLHPAIVDREIEIVHVLEDKVLAHDVTVAAACDACAELDCLLSLAEASRTFDYVRPHMSEESVLDIKGGRHPLQERVVDTFVPNDTFMVGGAGVGATTHRCVEADDVSDASEQRQARSVVVCTGANACGKSVYLKQTALIVYMAQIGCFVPAESAIIGIIDKIFTRVQTRESVSKLQSAFMIDLSQVSFALRNMTPRSLLILDEFGKGTISSDGAGLFCGVLTHLLSLGPRCPKVLAATHFHDLFRDDLLSPALPITFLHMQVLLTSSGGEVLDGVTMEERDADDSEGRRVVAPGESITYLYRVAPGLCLDSYASKCALAFGLAPRLVQRAQHVSDLLSTHAVGMLLDEGMTPAEQEDLADAEAVCRRFLKWDLKTDGERDARAWLREIVGRTEE